MIYLLWVASLALEQSYDNPSSSGATLKVMGMKWRLPSDNKARRKICVVPPLQNGHHFSEYIFKCILTNEKFCISIQISLQCMAASVQLMA